MNDDQFNKMMALLKIIAQNTAAIAAQANLQRPLTGAELGQIATDVQHTAEMLQSGLEVAVLFPGVERERD